mmetsp:Transcript_39164/g.94277  ORF Transcript_39164/g.94277 Transcript_39164/m.94277 type:complete len:112 (+) Transcript_39164:463-798(+)
MPPTKATPRMWRGWSSFCEESALLSLFLLRYSEAVIIKWQGQRDRGIVTITPGLAFTSALISSKGRESRSRNKGGGGSNFSGELNHGRVHAEACCHGRGGSLLSRVPPGFR